MAWRPQLKICGLADADDARFAGEAGADYGGVLVDVSFSERSLTLDEAERVASAATVPIVVLLCDPDEALAAAVAERIRPFAIQLLCCETPDFVRALKASLPCQIWKSVHLPAPEGQRSPDEYADAGADALLIDSAHDANGFLRMGGTGRTVDWSAAADLIARSPIPVWLAGGINPDNVAAALRATRPAGIDLCSGVESRRGKKDPEKVRALVRNFRAAIQSMESESR